MTAGLISVIVPVYNTEDTLEKCVGSIISQTYQKLDIILVDDGSTDISGTICDIYAEHDSRVRVFHTANNGVAAARNLALEKALENNSDYILFVDADDFIEPCTCEYLLSAIEEVGADVSQCATSTDGFRTSKKSKVHDETYTGQKEIFEAFLTTHFGNVLWGKLYKAGLFQEIRFPENTNYEDKAVTYKVLFLCDKIVTISYPGYHYVTRENSITHTRTAKNFVDSWQATRTQYEYLQQKLSGVLDEDMLSELPKIPARSISYTWRLGFGCDRNERKRLKPLLREMSDFEREHLRHVSKSSWPLKLTVPLLLARNSTMGSLVLGYIANQAFIFLFPEKAKSRR